jgi:hypothetical protein
MTGRDPALRPGSGRATNQEACHMAATPDERPQVKPFAQFLQETRAGLLHAELSDALADIVARCREHQRKGSLTLVIGIAPNKDGVTLTVSDDVRIKAPSGDRGAAIFYADDYGNLNRRDPRQPELPLTVAGGTSTNTVTVATPAGSSSSTGTEG